MPHTCTHTRTGWSHCLLCPACSWNTPRSGRDSSPRALTLVQRGEHLGAGVLGGLRLEVAGWGLHPVLQHSDLDTGDRYKWIFVTKKGRLTHLCRTTSPSLSKSITSPSSSLNPSTKPDTAQMKILLHIYWCCRRLTCEFVQLPRLWKPIVNLMDHLQH